MALTGSTNAEKIWNYLKSHGLTDEGTAGLMGNIYAESGLIPNNLQNTYEYRLGYTDEEYTKAVDQGKYRNFVHDSAGYGLCQWTYWSRKDGLLTFAKAAGKSIGDLEMQLDYLMKELGGYSALLNLLKTTNDLQKASDRVLLDFERPADQSDSVKKKRASYGQKYLDQFGNKPVEQDVIDAIDKLYDLKVINSPYYWKQHYKDTQYVDKLIKSAAAVITEPKTRFESLNAAVDALVAAGVVSSPDYWKKQTGAVADLVKALGGAVATKSIVTATQLRQRVCDIINGWVGSVRGDAKHLEILNIYNNYRPLARGYTVKVGDAHCATTVSATWIKAGIAQYTGTECGVDKFIQVAKQKMLWVENDAYVPKIGDACVYDWDDGYNYAVYDNTGYADHIGIVTAVSPAGKSFTVTEGNMSGGRVGKREMAVNGRYIRGFITPNYDGIAKIFNEKGVVLTSVPASAGSATTTYTVLAGDTLSGIAYKKLGDANRWQEIKTLNGLTSDIIYVGQTLKLPLK